MELADCALVADGSYFCSYEWTWRSQMGNSELDVLKSLADRLVVIASDRSEAPAARSVAQRLQDETLTIAVVGEFNRGKSTLLNALLGAMVVPVGATPVTAVAVELRFGSPGAQVETLAGDRYGVPTHEVPTYVTEAGNPNNVLGVRKVLLSGLWSLLEPGVTLIDTPGLSSLHSHNTKAAREAFTEADGAVVVMAADAPLSEVELELVETLQARCAPTFYVLSKADRLTKDETAQVRSFVGASVRARLGFSPLVYAVDGRHALDARLSRRDVGPDGLEFDLLLRELERFIAEDLIGARGRAARTALAHLGGSLQASLCIEQAARRLESRELSRLIERFADESAYQSSGFEDDCLLLSHAVERIGESSWQRLSEFARSAPSTHYNTLKEVATSAPRRSVVDALRDAIRDSVEGDFARLRASELMMVEEEWMVAAVSFRRRVQARVNEAREAAASLFHIELPTLELPDVVGQRERFSVLLLDIGTALGETQRLVILLPGRLARSRALAHSVRRLREAFEQHAGRSRWDVHRRLDDAKTQLVSAMRQELETTIGSICDAACRAQKWHDDAPLAQASEAASDHAILELSADLAALGVVANGS
jgi:GTP-binding protein EngB required for normal cell division